MDGIEALKALKNGKTVIHYIYEDRRADHRDCYFRYDFKYTYDKDESSKSLLCKFRCERYWHEFTNPTEFWMKSHNFEVVGEDSTVTQYM